MKKMLKLYLILWAIMFVLFNAAVIALPREFTLLGVAYEKFGGASWVTLIVLELCFLLQLLCTVLAFRQNKLSGTFYRLPLFRLSRAGVIVTLLLSVVAMLAFIPSWIPLALTVLVLVLYAAAVLKAAAAAQIVEGVDEKVRTKTAFMRALTADAGSLLAKAKSEPVRTVCSKVYEALRYSDPVSAADLLDVEDTIRDRFDALTEAVSHDDGEAANDAGTELLALLSERNQKCRAAK